MIHGISSQIVLAIARARLRQSGPPASHAGRRSHGSRIVRSPLGAVQCAPGIRSDRSPEPILRHTTSPLGPRLHLLLAFAVFAAVILTSRSLGNAPPNIRRLRVLLHAVVGLQILLGIEAWVMKYAYGFSATAFQPVRSATRSSEQPTRWSAICCSPLSVALAASLCPSRSVDFHVSHPDNIAELEARGMKAPVAATLELAPALPQARLGRSRRADPAADGGDGADHRPARRAARGRSAVPSAALLHAVLATGLVTAGASILNQVPRTRHRRANAANRKTARSPAGRIRPHRRFRARLDACGSAGWRTCSWPCRTARRRRHGIHVRQLRRAVHAAQAADDAEHAGRRRARGLAAGDRLDGGSRPTRLGALALFLIVFVWQVPHFLAIAWMYRDDYAPGRAADAHGRRPQGRAHRPADAALRPGAGAGQPGAGADRHGGTGVRGRGRRARPLFPLADRPLPGRPLACRLARRVLRGVARLPAGRARHCCWSSQVLAA